MKAINTSQPPQRYPRLGLLLVLGLVFSGSIAVAWSDRGSSLGNAKEHGSTKIPREIAPGFFRSPTLFSPSGIIEVNSTAQSPGASGDCTLGEALQAANTNLAVDGCSAGSTVGADTIMLPAGTYTLSTVAFTDNGFFGDAGLPGITTDVVIQGAGSETTIIERSPAATDQFRLMVVANQNGGSIVLNDLTMRGGRSNTYGGALYTAGRPVTLNRVIFDDNRAVIYAGAVATTSQGGVLVANDCTFINNQTNGQGGAIVASPATISNSTFTGNSAVYGGALYFVQGSAADFKIVNSTFRGNRAAESAGIGGAIFFSGTATIQSSRFESNSAGLSNSSGGAIAGYGTLNLFDSVLNENEANWGGGLHLSNCNFNISRTTISNNHALTHFGGGIYLNTGSGTLSASTINGNSAGIDGGGLWAHDIKLTLTNVTVDGNSCGQYGGGVYYAALTPLTFALNNVTLTANRAAAQGGGIFRYDYDGFVTAKNSIIALNTSGINNAPDIYAPAAGTFTSLGYNLIGIRDGANFTNAAGDQTGTTASPVNPLLGPLQDNGGATLSRVPLSNSPALDAANPASPGSGGATCESSDQRGVNRPQSGDGVGTARCDKGAVERTAGKFEFSAATYNVDEGGATLTVSVSRGIGDFGPVSVGYATNDGSAAAGSDYVATSGTLIFEDPPIAGASASSASNIQTFEVQILDDPFDEPYENFNIVLTNPTGGASLGPINTSVVSILDNDLPAVSITDVTIDEGDSGTTTAAFNLSLTLPSDQQVTVNYETGDGTATSGSDYMPESGTAVFAPGETSKTINVNIQGDVVREADETFFLNLTAIANGTLARSQGKGTIRNDDFLTDLILLLFDSPDPVNVGEELTYKINVFNNGNSVNGVVLSNTLPANVTFVSATSNQGICEQKDVTVTCDLGSIAQEEFGVVTIVVRPKAAGAINNSATVESADPDNAPQDNSASVTTTVNNGPIAPPPCVPMPNGLVSWWPFEGSGNDILTNNNALLVGRASFVPGTVGQSLTFDAADDHARVPASSTLDVGAGNGLTFDAWIYPPEISTARPLIEWSGGPGLDGVHVWMSADFGEGGQGVGSLFVNLVDKTGAYHIFSSPPGVLIANAWQHIAITYDKTSGVGTIYRNGAKVAEQNLGTFTPQTSRDLYFGYRPAGVLAERRFLGALDEADLFDRALSQTEIIGILMAGSGGKCIPAVISIAELITLNDAPALFTSAMIRIDENISVHDTPSLLPAAMIGVNEQINVNDAPDLPVIPTVIAPTPVGNLVTIAGGGITIIFENVTVAGTTTLAPIDLNSLPGLSSALPPADTSFDLRTTTMALNLTDQLPAGYELSSNSVAYDISTTAQYSGPITIRFNTPSVTDPAVFASLRVLHGENGTLIDRTTNQDFAGKTIGATVKSLSPFVVAQLVTTPRLLLQATARDLRTLRQTITDKQDQQKLDAIVKHLEDALDSGNWLDQAHLTTNRGESVFGKTDSAILKLTELSRDKKTTIAPLVLSDFVKRLAQFARLLAQAAIIDANSANADLKEISNATEALFSGDARAATGNYNQALNHYREAWRYALHVGR